LAKRSRRIQVRRGLSDAERRALVRKWRRWAGVAFSQLNDLLVRHETFTQLRDIVKRNPKTTAPAYFVNWMVTNYVCAATVGIRRLCDHGARAGSLGLLLRDIVQHPGVLRRSRDRRAISAREVRADRRALRAATDRIKLLVNKRVAHADKHGSIRRLPTYDDLDRAFEVLDRLTAKYLNLVAGSGWITCKLERQYDWHDVLTFPWITSADE